MPVPPVDGWKLVPFQQFGPLKLSATLAEVMQVFGPSAVKRTLASFDGAAGVEVTALVGATEVKVWFGAEGQLTFIAVAGRSSVWVGGQTVELLDAPTPHALTPRLKAFPPYGVTLFHQSGQPPRLNVNTRAHLQQLLPLVELPATTDARGRRTKYSLKALMKAAPALAQVGRPAWVARVKESADVADASKLSGAPFETPQQRAPVCPGCEAPLSMILQLNPADLPKAVGARLPGLVQYFMCTEDACFYDEVEGASVARVLAVPKKRAKAVKTSRALLLSGWQASTDYNAGEADAGLEAGPRERAQYEVQQTGREWQQAFSDAYPLAGEKLGGWPRWVQSAETPVCAACRSSVHMRLVFQVTDATQGALHGSAYLFQCERHPKQLGVQVQST